VTDRTLHVLALGKYGELAASSRQRMVQYRRPLAARGIDVEFEALLSNDYVQSLANERRPSPLLLLHAYMQRINRLVSLRRFDLLWVQNDLLPYVPGFLETSLLRTTVPVVYDCDDATFHSYDRHNNPFVRSLLARKIQPLLRRARAAMCGNEYLKAYVEKYCANASVVPTVVDTGVYLSRASRPSSGPPTIGWVGSASTWIYVKPLIPLLRQLAAARKATIRAVGVGARSKTVPEFEFIDWSLATEVHEIQGFDIGIMPLTDDDWSRGKCGYKLIQYMACGLPVVASPVGVNTRIVRHGQNGFLASTEGEWKDALATLLSNPELRASMGEAGRALVENEYSLRGQAPRVAEILRSAAA